MAVADEESWAGPILVALSPVLLLLCALSVFLGVGVFGLGSAGGLGSGPAAALALGLVACVCGGGALIGLSRQR